MPSYTLTVLGPLQPKERARTLKNGHTYTPTRTADQEYAIRRAWADTGQGMLEGYVGLTLTVERARPASHWLKTTRGNNSGRLSAVGRREYLPGTKPDLDNQLKIVKDSLSGIAYTDDAKVCKVTTEKVWAYDSVSRWTVTLRRL